ncbi:MAG: mannose-1-phosphate guanylyltransferase/mannose-6-phosphate isomerase [Usitatibacter sp.]
MAKTEVRAVILAGGSGTRLWPLSRLQSPKQFLKLVGAESLLEATVTRLHPLVDDSQVTIVTSEDLAKGEGFHLLQRFRGLLEPVGRNTAPAIAIAALEMGSEPFNSVKGSDPVMIVLPSDHLIRDVPAFHEALNTAIGAAREGKLVTFGIHPTAPETGFGYIRASGGGAVRKVTEFREKPDRATAEGFVASGEYYWNSGMFVWRANRILEAIEQYVPQLAAVLATMRAEVERGATLAATVKAHFADCPSISIDHGVLEKCGDVYMVPGNFGWSDVGSWDAVYEVAEKDKDRNAVQGNALLVECKNTLIRSEGRLIAAVGVEDVAVVETPDAILVSRMGQSQKVRQVVDELVRRSGHEHIEHTTVRRPWGAYTVLEEGPGFKIKRIEVRPGGRLSLQSHKFRSEHWVVVSGVATVTRDSDRFLVNPNESTFIPIGAKHRLENEGAEPLQIIEVQVGSQVTEADIQRYDDAYGRTPAKAR